jgi:hypothetical protein
MKHTAPRASAGNVSTLENTLDRVVGDRTLFIDSTDSVQHMRAPLMHACAASSAPPRRVSRKFNPLSRFALIAAVLCVSSRFALADDSIYLKLQRFADAADGNIKDEQTSPGPSLAFSMSGNYAYGSDSVSYGAMDFEVHSVSTYNNSGQMYPDATITQSYLISGTDSSLNGSQGTAVFVDRLSGGFTPASGLAFAGENYFNVNGTTVGVNGAQYALPPTVTEQDAFTFNSAGAGLTRTFQVGGETYAGSADPGTMYHAAITLSVRLGALTLYDSNNNRVAYTASSAGGSARAMNVSTGNTYAGISLTNDTNNAHLGSTVSLLGGTASSNDYVQLTFTAPPPERDGALPVSDTVDVSRTNTDPVVIQLSYDKPRAQSLFGFGAPLVLGWHVPANWTVENAVAGNTGGTPTFVNGPYDPSQHFHPGYYGHDAANGVVWAVVNHNSEFFVTNVDTLKAPSVTHLVNGHIFVRLAGVPSAVNRVEVSSDLTTGSWSTVATANAGPTGIVTCEDTTAADVTRRFYRVSSP